jgi:ABC-type Zn uptake system ZnuABC Zn-binding protein ZnuA
MVRNVAGGRAEVVGILPANADPHEYEPRPSDTEAVADADLIVRSGGEVDSWLDQLVESSGSTAPELTLLDHVQRLGEDPHWWQDPRNAMQAVKEIAASLAEVDPAGARAYRRAATAYDAELAQLDRYVSGCIARLRPDERKLVTEHDALAYYADRYGLQVIGAAIPALSTQAQPSAGDTAALVDQVEAQGVKAVFPEAGLNPRLQQAIADEAGVTVGQRVWADSLGPPGSPAETYVGAMRANTDAIAAGLSGGRVRCRPEA